MFVIGYCGVVGMFFENMMIFFKEVVRVGVYGIEFDVYMIKDGEFVVIYDEKVD